MSDETPDDESTTAVRFDPGREFALGLQAGVMACGFEGDDAPEGTREVVLTDRTPETNDTELFAKELRDLLEFYFDEIDADCLVKRVEVTPEGATAYVRE